MTRRLITPQTRRPLPLMMAAGTDAAGRKRIPNRAATVKIIFGKTGVGAKPAARRFRLPFAQRTANPAVIYGFVFGFFDL